MIAGFANAVWAVQLRREDHKRRTVPRLRRLPDGNWWCSDPGPAFASGAGDTADAAYEQWKVGYAEWRKRNPYE